jgi:hypothetical protein
MGLCEYVEVDDTCVKHLSCAVDPIELLATSQLAKLKELLGFNEFGVLVPENYKIAMEFCRNWLNFELQGTGWLVTEPDIFRIFNQLHATSN